ncbi:MAG: ABC transporter ATP-binding protein [Acetilactobacillus jinshanensis]
MHSLIKKYLNKKAVIAAVLFLIIQVACDLYLPTVTVSIVDKGIVHDNLPYIWQQGIQMLVVTLVGLLGAAGNIYFAATQSQGMGKKIRLAVYRKVIHFSNQNLDHFGDASLITRATNDVVQIQNLMINVLRMMIMSPLLLFGAIILAFIQSPKLTVTFVAAFALLGIVIMIILKFAVPRFKSLQRQTDTINLIFREGLTGVRVIRAFNRDPYEQRRFGHANQRYAKTGIQAYTLAALMFPIMTFILNLTNIGIVSLGSYLIAHYELEVGNLVAFMTYSTQILISFMMLAMLFVFVPRAEVSAQRIDKVLDTKNTVRDAPRPFVFQKGRPASLRFNHVDLKYKTTQKPVLDDINFSAGAGQTVAIIGDTGSGKSSIVNLISRLYDPVHGNVLLDNVPVNQLSQSDLHQRVAITMQKAILFSGTIRSNLKFGNEQATDQQIWHALAVAQAADFVKRAGGLNAKVAQNGDNFSGGQKQRLSIARTVIKPADVYIFDDSFSALDFATDAKVRENLYQDPKIQRAVTVIVAQRISTIMGANLILVLHHGRIVGKGTHRELMKNNPFYRSIYNSQIKKGANRS